MKATINLVIFLNFVILKTSSGSEDVTSSIYGGKPAGFLHIHNGEKRFLNDGQFPYIVGIAEQKEHICGGVLLKKNIVLTAAHCFKQTLICDVQIWAGSYEKIDKKSDTIQIRDVHDVVIHYAFNLELSGPQPNDIALVFLKKPFNLTPFVQPATVATKMQRDQFMGTTVVLLGYGKKGENEISPNLLLGAVTMLEERECVKTLKDAQFINSVLCVKCKKEVCTIATGDSGSPLVKIDKHGKHILLGIASFAFVQYSESEVSGAFMPAVYTDVAEYKEWFKIAKKSKKPKTNRIFNSCINR